MLNIINVCVAARQQMCIHARESEGCLLRYRAQHARLKAHHGLHMLPGLQVLMEWGRYDRSPATLRLQLLLNEMSATPQYTIRVQETALDAATVPVNSSAKGAAAGAVPLGSSRAFGLPAQEHACRWNGAPQQ